MHTPNVAVIDVKQAPSTTATVVSSWCVGVGLGRVGGAAAATRAAAQLCSVCESSVWEHGRHTPQTPMFPNHHCDCSRGPISSGRHITSSAVLAGPEGSTPGVLVATGRSDGEVACLNPRTGVVTAVVCAADGKDAVRGVHDATRGAGQGGMTVLVVNESGLVRGFRQAAANAWEECWRWNTPCKEVACTVRPHVCAVCSGKGVCVGGVTGPPPGIPQRSEGPGAQGERVLAAGVR